MPYANAVKAAVRCFTAYQKRVSGGLRWARVGQKSNFVAVNVIREGKE